MSSQYFYSKQQAPRKGKISQNTIAGTLFTGSTNLSETINLTLRVFRGRFTDFIIPQIFAYSPLVIGMPFLFANFGSIFMMDPYSASNPKSTPDFEMLFAFFSWFAVILMIFSFLYPFSAIINSRVASDELHCGTSTWREELKDKFWTRYWVLVFSLAIVNVSIILVVGVVIILLALAIAALSNVSGSSGAIAFSVIFGSLVFIAVMILAIAIPFMFYLIEPICSIEDVSIDNIWSLLLYGPIEQIKRTLYLVKANFLKFLGITIVVLMLVNFIQSIFMAPLSIGATIYELYHAAKKGVLTSPNPNLQISWIDILRQSAGTIVTIIFAPVYAILKTVLYYQTRIEKEQYDLDLMLVNIPEDTNKINLEEKNTMETESPW